MKTIDLQVVERLFSTDTSFNEGDLAQVEQEARDIENYFTTGPGKVEINALYANDGGAHRLRVYDKVSPDVLLVYQSKMCGFYRVVKQKRKPEPIPRSAKESTLKDGLRAV